MDIKMNYAVTAFFVGSILLITGIAFAFIGGQLSSTVEEMFGKNGAFTIWGLLLTIAGIALNAFASRKA